MSSPPLPSRRPTPSLGGQTLAMQGPSTVKQAKVPEEKTIILNFQPDAGNVDQFDTDIARILLENDLPVTVIVRETFHSPRSFLSLNEGVLLTLHFIRRPTRVYATDNHDNEFYLPLHARQLYEVLPMNPVHDDKEFEGTEALIKGRPLPKRVRIKEAHFSGHPGEAQEVGDIIEIEGIEMRPVPIDSNNPPQKCVVGKCNGVPFAFSESMISATYSSMPSIDSLTLSEIAAKFPLPLRVRRVDRPDHEMVLHRKDTEYHVVATTSNSKQVLSVPVTWQGKVAILQNTNLDKLFRHLLPPLYPLVNTTWGLGEPGRCDLQPTMKEVAQPLVEILDDWPRTKEGQNFVLETCKQTVESYKLKVEQLLEEKQRLRNLETMYADRYRKAPPVPSRDGVQPPPRPPRPTPASSLPSSSTTRSSASSGTNRDSTGSTLHSQWEELMAVLQSRKQTIERLKRNLQDVGDENRRLKERNSSLLKDVTQLQAEADDSQMYATIDGGNIGAVGSQPLYVGLGGVTKEFQSYSIEDVIQLLHEIKLEIFVDKFRENMIDGMLLTNLTENELCEELGMSRIQAKRLLLVVKRMQQL